MAEGVVRLAAFACRNCCSPSALGRFRTSTFSYCAFCGNRHCVRLFWSRGDLLHDLRAGGHEIAADVLDVGERQHVERVTVLRYCGMPTTGLCGPELVHDHFLGLLDLHQALAAVDGVGPLPRVELTSTPMLASKVEVSIGVHLPLMRRVRRWLGDSATSL